MKFGKATLAAALACAFSLGHAAAPLAQDATTRAVLAHPLARIDQGVPANGQVHVYIHRNFPQLVEQNVARMDAAGARAFVDNLSDLEWRHLAQLYANAVSDNGGTGRLLPLLAARVDGVRLGRIASAFGFAPVYEAVLNASPSQTQVFLAHARMEAVAPAPGVKVAATMAAAPATTPPPDSWAEDTPNEIYIALRSAAVGSQSSSAAVLETGVYLARHVSNAFDKSSSVIAPFEIMAKTYEPFLSNVNLMNELTGALLVVSDSGTPLTQGQNEIAAGSVLELPAASSAAIGTGGGDYGLCSSYEVAYSGESTPVQPTPPKNQF